MSYITPYERLFDPSTPEPDRKHLFLRVVSELGAESKTILSTVEFPFEHRTPSSVEALRENLITNSLKNQRCLLAAKDIFGSAQSMIDQFLENVGSPAREALIENLLQMSGFALLVESEVFTEVSEFIHEWHEKDPYVAAKNRRINLRSQLNTTLNLFKRQGMPLPLASLIKADEIRDPRILRFWLPDHYQKEIDSIISSSMASTDVADTWKRKADTLIARRGEEAVTPMIEKLGLSLQSLPYEGTSYLRQAFFGQSEPSGKECQARLGTMLRCILNDDINDANIEMHASAIRENPSYVDKALVESIMDILTDIKDSHYERHADEPDNDSFLASIQMIPQLGKVLDQLEISPESRIKILMKTLGEYDRGRIFDLESTSLENQAETLMNSVASSIQRSGSDHMDYIVLAGVVKTLPKTAVHAMAKANEHSLGLIYAITGDSSLLKVASGRQTDNVFSMDLGL